MTNNFAADRTVEINSGLQMVFDHSALHELEARIEHNGTWDKWELFKLAYEAGQASLVHHFDELQCMRYFEHLEPLPHQLEAAKKVLGEMRGRAILADEVGLGKTIEAGLILKEYMVRGQVEKVLILVPASLVLQWVRELNQKFGIAAIAQKKQYMWSNNVVVASIDTAKRSPHREIILEQNYDMLIIDEAHKLKNKKTANVQFVSQIHKKYCLLLTATPVQNDLDELYNLINILKPGQLGGDGHFKLNYVQGKRIPKNEDQLREQLSSIMIRNSREEGNHHFTKRIVRNITLTLSPEEQSLYDGVTDFVRQKAQEASGNISNVLSLVTLQREVCSSRDAVFITLVNMFKKTPENSPQRTKIWELVHAIKQITSNTKAEKTIELIRQMEGKVIIFTEYRATQQYLIHFLNQHGLQAVPYRGGMNRGKKDWMMDLFRNRAQVMVATEAGGEGINLQFCNQIINFDLPWNPMRVEQRIGRVHRLGQDKDVSIYNFATTGTIEEHIVHLLHEKINMFELVVGQLDVILEKMEQNHSLEESLSKIILQSKDEQEIRQKVDQLGSALNHLQHEQNHREMSPL